MKVQYEQEEYVIKSLVICATQLVSGLLLKMLKYFQVMLKIFEYFQVKETVKS